jgi:hypothetical protein
MQLFFPPPKQHTQSGRALTTFATGASYLMPSILRSVLGSPVLSAHLLATDVSYPRTTTMRCITNAGKEIRNIHFPLAPEQLLRC